MGWQDAMNVSIHNDALGRVDQPAPQTKRKARAQTPSNATGWLVVLGLVTALGFVGVGPLSFLGHVDDAGAQKTGTCKR